MKKEQLSDAIGRVDDEIVEEVMRHRMQGVRSSYRSWIAVAACLCVLLGCLFTLPLWQRGDVTPELSDTSGAAPGGNAPSTTTTTQKTETSDAVGDENDFNVQILGLPSYPAMAPRPTGEAFYNDEQAREAWSESVRAQTNQYEGYSDGMTAFYNRTMQAFLAGEAGENRVYSPLNLYLSLSMLAECAEGTSRQQILDLLGVSQLPALRRKNAALWNAVYRDDGAMMSRLANSLWLNSAGGYTYRTATVDQLADSYYASVFSGVMGSDSYNATLRGWLNEQTEGLLEEQVAELEMDRNTALALASTVCFRAKWQNEFNPERTKPAPFHAADGDVICDFLNKKTMDMIYWGDNYLAVRLTLDVGSYSMWILLPDEGVSVDALVGDEQVLSLLQDPDGSGQGEYREIEMSIPKFDVVSDRDLKEGLQQLGLTDVFSVQQADFSGIVEDEEEPVWLDRVQHAARVAIDEEGCTAAAYTVEMLDGTGAPPPGVVSFVADRPFLFAITGPTSAVASQMLLFTGVVAQP